MFGIMYFLNIYTDFSVNCKSILKNIYLFERVSSRGDPIVTKQESDEGIQWNSKKILKFHRHLQCLCELSKSKVLVQMYVDVVTLVNFEVGPLNKKFVYYFKYRHNNMAALNRPNKAGIRVRFI